MITRPFTGYPGPIRDRPARASPWETGDYKYFFLTKYNKKKKPRKNKQKTRGRNRYRGKKKRRTAVGAGDLDIARARDHDHDRGIITIIIIFITSLARDAGDKPKKKSFKKIRKNKLPFFDSNNYGFFFFFMPEGRGRTDKMIRRLRHCFI